MKAKLASALFALSLGLLASSAHAQFDGIYFGLGVGAYKGALVGDGNSGTIGDMQHRSALNGNLGFGHSFGILNLAIEAAYTSSLGQIDFGSGFGTFKIRDAWSASLLPGIRFGDRTLFYGRVGFARAKASGDIFVPPDSGVNHTGGVLGIGAKGAFNRHASLVVEYQSYDFAFKDYPNTFIPGRVSPRPAGVLIGLQYTF